MHPSRSQRKRLVPSSLRAHFEATEENLHATDGNLSEGEQRAEEAACLCCRQGGAAKKTTSLKTGGLEERVFFFFSSSFHNGVSYWSGATRLGAWLPVLPVFAAYLCSCLTCVPPLALVCQVCPVAHLITCRTNHLLKSLLPLSCPSSLPTEPITLPTHPALPCPPHLSLSIIIFSSSPSHLFSPLLPLVSSSSFYWVHNIAHSSCPVPPPSPALQPTHVFLYHVLILLCSPCLPTPCATASPHHLCRSLSTQGQGVRAASVALFLGPKEEAPVRPFWSLVRKQESAARRSTKSPTSMILRAGVT